MNVKCLCGKNVKTDEILKQNAINLAREHKKNCKDPECNISLILIADLLNKAGIELKDNELWEFL